MIALWYQRSVIPVHSPGAARQNAVTGPGRPGSGDRIGPGPHEHDIWRLAQTFSGENSAFIDIGAHVGHFALRMAGSFSKVIAIEPNPAAVHALRLNLQLNHIGNVDVHPVAAHNSRARLRLWDPFSVTAGACTRTLAPGEPVVLPADCPASALAPAFLGEVDALPIDVIASRLRERVEFLKIDIEGHEGIALSGAASVIRAHQPAILIEMHDSMYGDRIRHDVIEQLTSYGYAWCDFSLYQKSKFSASDMCQYTYAEPLATGRGREFLEFAERANLGAASRWLTVP